MDGRKRCENGSVDAYGLMRFQSYENRVEYTLVWAEPYLTSGMTEHVKVAPYSVHTKYCGIHFNIDLFDYSCLGNI